MRFDLICWDKVVVKEHITEYTLGRVTWKYWWARFKAQHDWLFL